MSRRDTLLRGMSAALVGSAVKASAQNQHAHDVQATGSDPLIPMFMAVSHRLTDRDTLDQRIGVALCAGVVQNNPARKEQIQTLYDLLTKGSFASAADFARAAEKQDAVLKDTIHDVMTGWYRGVADGKVVVYRSALMFDITKDAVYPKTYAAGGPFYWTTKPPEVALPNGQPALSPSKFVIEPT
ncbi:sorbitol dehydrogenase family protein [Acetobacter fallax]|uniref:Sorbitol dehydrogenase n=1 Tax=Acetobacter fallax TaxID=1737473 RepID=A0ABX0KFX8_9PROT|nr:sorbitol dehydrogenase family protein [Acetobacter fallax]NHO34422.1 sorbitol dehydrogenase [Acetobacter fallax]NHO37978.1 sorbitol dehydrogenase [Acetobacter fallax]